MPPSAKRSVLIELDGDGYIALCPELDIASQGDTVAEARRNLEEAVALFMECASPTEIKQRLERSAGAAEGR
jgi:predicted RNase H-like HicB family nuclease